MLSPMWPPRTGRNRSTPNSRSLAGADDVRADYLELAREWGNAAECNERGMEGHCDRVADIACAIGGAVGYDDDAVYWLRIGALLHDVGKLALPPALLTKPGSLDAAEWELVRRHPASGVAMVTRIAFPCDVTPIVASHHERWDGLGYPDGLAGQAIPLAARMVCIADAYDALTSERSYKRALSHDTAMAVMRADSGRHFDARLFAGFEGVARIAARSPGSWVRRERAKVPMRKWHPPRAVVTDVQEGVASSLEL